MKKGEIFLVIGGCGFLGFNVVEVMLKRWPECDVRAFDVFIPDNQPQLQRVTYIEGDMTDYKQVKMATEGVSGVIHTASPPEGKSRQLYLDVNVKGTKNVIRACFECEVPALVYTSTASVVFDGSDLSMATEVTPYCTSFLDPYIESKVLAEQEVLAAAKEGLATCALRPSGIYGPGDRQAWPGMIAAGRKRQSRFQLGDGSNEMDWTFVGNLAHAHCLAMEKLKEDGDLVSGEAFFITDGNPMPFWDMPKFVWRSMGFDLPRFVIPAFIAVLLGLVIDMVVSLVSPLYTIRPTFTYFRARIATSNRTFSIEKARRLLDYDPPFSGQDARELTLKAFTRK